MWYFVRLYFISNVSRSSRWNKAELRTILSRTNKLFKDRILNLSNRDQELSVNKIHSVNSFLFKQSYYFTKGKQKIFKNYIGISSVRWKWGYNNRIYSFSHECLRNQTALYKDFWKLKNRSLTLKIQWKILMGDVIFVGKKIYKLCYTLVLLTN